MLLGALAACLAFILYAGTRIYGTIGPSRAAVTADGKLVLLSHGRLHVFGADGLRQSSADLAAIGAPPRPSDFELHRDGRAVIADPDNPELVRCTLPAGPCERVPVALFSVPGQEVLPLNAAKLLVDDDAGRYYMSDNAAHRVVAMTFDGKALKGTAPNVVRHPNRLSLPGADRLAVVDTDHRRIAVFEVNASGIGKMVASQSTAAPGIARPGRRWPFAAQRLPDGGAAILVAADGMRDADVIVFDADGKPRLRADLGADSDPFDVTLWRGRLWVADATRYRFDAVNLDGTPAAALEDTAFAAELVEAHDAPERWKLYRYVAQFTLVAIPLLGALLLWRLGGEAPPAARVPASAVAQASPAGAVIEWVSPRPAFVRRARRIANAVAWGLLVLYAAWIGLFLAGLQATVFSWFGVRYILPQLAIVFLLALVAFFAVRAAAGRWASLRLGASAQALHYEMKVKGVLGFPLRSGVEPWPQVFFDGTRLLAGPYLVALARPVLGQVFDAAELRRVVLSHVPPANVVARDRLTWLAIGRQKLRILVIAALITVVGATALAVRARLL